MATYAAGKKALAVCDICGNQCKYRELKVYIFNLKPNGLRVCPSCWDKDQPQLRVGANFIPEGIALLNPRPDSSLASSRALFGWNPVLGLTCVVSLGTVTVTTT